MRNLTQSIPISAGNLNIIKSFFCLFVRLHNFICFLVETHCTLTDSIFFIRHLRFKSQVFHIVFRNVQLIHMFRMAQVYIKCMRFAAILPLFQQRGFSTIQFEDITGFFAIFEDGFLHILIRYEKRSGSAILLNIMLNTISINSSSLIFRLIQACFLQSLSAELYFNVVANNRCKVVTALIFISFAVYPGCIEIGCTFIFIIIKPKIATYQKLKIVNFQDQSSWKYLYYFLA